jgi:hypothetical protein
MYPQKSSLDALECKDNFKIKKSIVFFIKQHLKILTFHDLQKIKKLGWFYFNMVFY